MYYVICKIPYFVFKNDSFRLCKAAKHIPDAAIGFHGSREFEEFPVRISKMLKVLKHARQSLKESKESVDKSYDDFLNELTWFIFYCFVGRIDVVRAQMS